MLWMHPTHSFTALINDGSGFFTANHNIPQFTEWVEVDYDNWEIILITFGLPLQQLETLIMMVMAISL